MLREGDEMDWVWTGLALLSVLFGILNGTMEAVSAAALTGAQSAVELCVGLCGALCLWNGVLRLLEAGGVAGGLTRLLRPLLCRLYPEAKGNEEALSALAENLSANLLGLGNAATPAGIRAARALAAGERATDGLCRLAVMNSASVTLLPATVCALRASLGSETPFDIVPAVWLTSGASLLAGLLTERVLRMLWRR